MYNNKAIHIKTFIPREFETCISITLGYYNKFIKLKDLRKYFHLGKEGIDLTNLKNFFNNNGFDTKIYKFSLDILKELNFPAIIFSNNNYSVVLEKINYNHAIIIDPNFGKKYITIEKLNIYLNNYILVPIPKEDLVSTNISKNSILGKMIICLQSITLLLKIFKIYIAESLYSNKALGLTIDIGLMFIIGIYISVKSFMLMWTILGILFILELILKLIHREIVRVNNENLIEISELQILKLRLMYCNKEISFKDDVDDLGLKFQHQFNRTIIKNKIIKNYKKLYLKIVTTITTIGPIILLFIGGIFNNTLLLQLKSLFCFYLLSTILLYSFTNISFKLKELNYTNI